MQDIVFYAAANETLGIVRDYANVRNQSAPTLVLGVSARLRMRLFADSESTAPYPISAFEGVSDWKWRMDADFDRDTPSKLVADTGNISVQTVTDTVNGESASFTEFTIPISETNTVELTEWLGIEKKRSGLTGELVGYDSSGNAVFVLQIDDFTVRNRVAGLNEPTSIRQEYLTRSQTELLVSSAAAAKQDKLTSANAGSNIAIDSHGVISNTYSLPYASASSPGGVMLANGPEVVSGTNTSKAVTPAALKTALSGGTQFIPQDVVSSFRAVTDLGSAATVSLAAGGAYKLSALSGDHYVTVDSAPAGKYGDDAHLELFVGNAALVHALDPLILMDALTPNAVNNCRIEYRDGTARMHVEDHDFGYVVTVAGGTEGTSLDGSLYYGLTGSTSAYIVFSHTTDGSAISLPSGTTVSRDVNIVGNGADKTTVRVGRLNKAGDVYSLSLNALTLKVLSPEDSGVVYSTAALHCVDCNITGSTALYYPVRSNKADIANCIVSGNTSTSRGIFHFASEAAITRTRFVDNVAATSVLFLYDSPVSVTDCYFSNQGVSGAIHLSNGSNADVTISGTTFATSHDDILTPPGTTVAFTGMNVLESAVKGISSGMGLAGISDGSISGSGTVSLAGSTTAFTAINAAISGITFTGATSDVTGALVGEGDLTLQNITVTGNTVSEAEGAPAITGSTSAVSVPHAAVEIGPESDFTISGGTYGTANDVLVSGYSVSGVLGGTVSLTGKIFAFGSGNSLTISDNAVIDMTGNTNSTAIAPGGDIIVGSGVKAVTTSGSTVNVTAGTYSEGSISNAGVVSSGHHIYGFDRQVTLNNPAVSFVELTDTSASGSARYTGISAADWKNIKKGLLETRACVMYSNKTTRPGGRKNKVMFYLSNSDFRYKENGQKLTAEEQLGKVMWDGALRLCNFMKIYPKLYIRIEEYGDPCIFSQTGATTTSQVAWKRDATSDVSGTSYGWKNGTTVIWTTTSNPAAGDKAYSDNACTTERDWPVVYCCPEHFVCLVSDRQDTGFILHPWFWTSEDGQTASDQYVGMFKGVACDASGDILTPVESAAGDFRTLGNPAIGTGMVRSIPGGRPACSNTLNNFRLYLGRAGVDATNAMFDWYKDLMLVFDTGCFDAQSRISGGLNLMQAYYWFELRQTGRTMQFGNRTCSLNADNTLDADIAGYWNGRITSKAAGGATSATTWQRNPANDKIANDVVSAYAWTAKINSVDTYIWTAAAEPAADDATYSDNTLTTVRTGCPVDAYTNGAEVRCTTFSWRGLEDIWGACWEFRDGIQKRQDATNTGFTGSYTESGYLVTNAISLYTSTGLLPSPGSSADTLPKTVTASLLNSSVSYADASVSLVKDWDKLSGVGTGLTQCFVQHPWPKKSGYLNVWDPLTNYPVMVAASALNSAYGDHFFNDATASSRVLYVGGSASNGALDGPGSVYVPYWLGYAASYVGVRPAASEN